MIIPFLNRVLRISSIQRLIVRAMHFIALSNFYMGLSQKVKKYNYSKMWISMDFQQQNLNPIRYGGI